MTHDSTTIGKKFCVGCGQRNVPTTSRNVRCDPCLAAFTAAGGVQYDVAPIVQHPSGMRSGGQKIFRNFARFCRICGSKLEAPRTGNRVDHALRMGGECHTCDSCAWAKRSRG